MHAAVVSKVKAAVNAVLESPSSKSTVHLASASASASNLNRDGTSVGQSSTSGGVGVGGSSGGVMTSDLYSKALPSGAAQSLT